MFVTEAKLTHTSVTSIMSFRRCIPDYDKILMLHNIRVSGPQKKRTSKVDSKNSGSRDRSEFKADYHLLCL